MQPDKTDYPRADSILIPLKTAQPRNCAYCELPITDSSYTLKWFSGSNQFMPVHNEHLTIKNTKQVKEMNS